MQKQQSTKTPILKCQLHNKEIIGVCMEKICQYQSRLLCNACQFTHQDCNKRIEWQQFHSQLLYILNPEQHKNNCSYFPQHSLLLNNIEEIFNKAKQKLKQNILELEQKQLAILLQEQGIILNSKTSLRWARQLVNLKNMEFNKQELDSAVIMIREKNNFNETIFNEIQLTMDKLNILNKDSLNTIINEFRLKNAQYDIQQLYNDAQNTINKIDKNYEYHFEDQIKLNRYKQLAGGHGSDSSIVSIIESEKYIISGSDNGIIVGWLKPSYILDFRIKTAEGLNSLVIGKVQDTFYLITGGFAQIQIYLLTTKQKLYQLDGHKSEIVKLLTFQLKILFSASKDGSIKKWDLKERQMIKSLNLHSLPISDMILDQELITVGEDGIVNFIDPSNFCLLRKITLKVPIFCIRQIKKNKYVFGLGNGNITILQDDETKNYRISDEVVYKVLPLNNAEIFCYSADGYLCFLNLKKNTKIFKSTIQKDLKWQALELIEDQLFIPHQGNIKVYYK